MRAADGRALTEVIAMRHDLSSVPLRRGEDPAAAARRRPVARHRGASRRG
ncbi:hypothetical protein ACWD0G_13730 [Streptomyces goshikiensis]